MYVCSTIACLEQGWVVVQSQALGEKSETGILTWRGLMACSPHVSASQRRWERILLPRRHAMRAATRTLRNHMIVLSPPVDPAAALMMTRKAGLVVRRDANRVANRGDRLHSMHSTSDLECTQM